MYEAFRKTARVIIVKSIVSLDLLRAINTFPRECYNIGEHGAVSRQFETPPPSHRQCCDSDTMQIRDFYTKKRPTSKTLAVHSMHE